MTTYKVPGVKEEMQLAMGARPDAADQRPPEEIVRGRCPECGESLVSNLYWSKVHGFRLTYQCWDSLMPEGRCQFYTAP